MIDPAALLNHIAPYRDSLGRVVESESAYAARIGSRLPDWPPELIKEWLHRHPDHLSRYAFLGFDRLLFQRQTWRLDQIPNREAFDDPGFCDDFQNVEERARYPHDWLAQFMTSNGTWNTPIVLLRVDQHELRPGAHSLKKPFHLLEGHRRLSFLNGLRSIGKANESHDVWVASIPQEV